MLSIHARQALLPGGWGRDVRVEIDDGTITAVSPGSPPEPADERVDALVPGMPNLHSHAFQRAMSGLAETPGPSSDSFWTWRDVMYRFALRMSPTELEVVATWLYIEMLEAGYTRVGEFHYLHHDRDGTPYGHPAEMATRIAAGAERSGIRLTLLPVFYAHGDFGGTAPATGQRRFVNDIDGFARLWYASKDALEPLDGAVLGVAPHSLRAVTPSELTAVEAMAPDGPIHIHVAEQRREVEGCLSWSGHRPVQWLLDAADVDERWCLIHATHMIGDEIDRLAQTGAVAGICPVTEANLGDGIFAGSRYVHAGGRYGVGTDSNTIIGVPDELRQLEYSQRLARGERNVMTRGEATGRALYTAAYRGGQQALGVAADGIATGVPADLVALDAGLIDTDDGDRLLNTWIFGQGAGVDRVWTGGAEVVQDGRHVGRDEAASAYRVVLRSLLDDRQH
jgi:formimidoylglutamate deiminase